MAATLRSPRGHDQICGGRRIAALADKWGRRENSVPHVGELVAGLCCSVIEVLLVRFRAGSTQFHILLIKKLDFDGTSDKKKRQNLNLKLLEYFFVSEIIYSNIDGRSVHYTSRRLELVQFFLSS